MPRIGTFSASLTGSFFIRPVDYIPGGGVPDDIIQTNADINLNYTLLKNLAISATLNTFRIENRLDTRPTATQLFSGVRLVLKTGSIGVLNDRIQLGGWFEIFAPFGREPNPPLLPFTQNEFGAGVHFIGSYYFDNIFPEFSSGIHLNLGFRNYSSSETVITRSPSPPIKVGNDLLTLRYALGFDTPLPIRGQRIYAFAELFGEFYLSASLQEFVYGRENFSYLGAGARYYVLDWLSVELMGQLLIIGGGDNTSYITRFGTVPVSLVGLNYAPWRIMGGAKVELGRRFRIPYAIDEALGLYDPMTYSRSERLRNRKIMDVLDERSQELADIFKEVRKQDSTLSGKIYYEIIIGTRGNVERVRLLVSTLDDNAYSEFTTEQFADAIRSWRFPPGSREVIFNVFKIELSRDGRLSIISSASSEELTRQAQAR
ncbi:MAG: hypothetical protein RML35_05390 [Chloroherpetonaceae bacterium]|nr:hypothetical protein [Chloroherpetonaceae bacterium]